MKTKLVQILYDMRHQPVIGWVTIIGTAMAIFLIMVVTMIQEVAVTPFAPESCRNRLLVGVYMHVAGENGHDGSSGLNQKTARRIYAGLEGIEHTSFMQFRSEPADVKGPTNDAFTAQTRRADAEFWNIFDHELIEGRYYTPEEAYATSKVAVISESTARRLFGSQNRAGNTFMINHTPYTVVGVVADNSSLALTGSGEVFIPTGINDESLNYDNEWSGDVAAAMLVKDGVDFETIRDQVKARYAAFDTELSVKGERTVYHEQPYDQRTIASGLHGSNNSPDPESDRKIRMAIYLILLLVPAINLSTMLHSRMRHRISEIGVRRAFGCTRTRLIADIITENFIVTLIGGVIGLLLGVVFASTYGGLYDTMDNFGSGNTPSLSVLLNINTILMSLLFCFILNIISAAIPAWQASRLNPINAINARK